MMYLHVHRFAIFIGYQFLLYCGEVSETDMENITISNYTRPSGNIFSFIRWSSFHIHTKPTLGLLCYPFSCNFDHNGLKIRVNWKQSATPPRSGWSTRAIWHYRWIVSTQATCLYSQLSRDRNPICSGSLPSYHSVISCKKNDSCSQKTLSVSNYTRV